MIHKLKKKIRSSRGFTLAETLLAVLILLIATAIVVEGIPMAKRVHDRTVDTANAQVMLSTAMTILRDELSVASDVSRVNGDDGLQYLKYVSGNTGCTVIIYPYHEGDSRPEGDTRVDGTVYMREYLDVIKDEDAVDALASQNGYSVDQELVFTSDGSLKLQLGAVDIPTDTSPLFTIHDICVHRRGQTEPLTSVGEYIIRTVRH